LAFSLGALSQEMAVNDQDKQPEWHLARQALSHAERSEMLARVTEAGTGMSAAELAGALDLTLAKARYHLLVLHRADLIAPANGAGERYIATLGP
jgi:predicted transcriptional regulator